MNLLKDVYISKSFYWLGKSLDNCFNCKYCRAKPISDNQNYNILPSEINPIFTNLPIVINLFYGDPLLQLANTLNYLTKLKQSKHKAPVIIITKGNLSNFIEQFQNYNLDLHIALSTIGLKHEVDEISYKHFTNNLDCISKIKAKFSCEFRPIMYGINDNEKIINNLFKICGEYNLPIGYSGLQGCSNLVKYWKDNNIPLKPFPDYNFSVKKPISDICNNIIQEASNKYNVPIFKKTSCLISYSHNLNRDYNAHYYRPNETGCNTCIMNNNCFTFKESQKDICDIKIPFKYVIENKINYKCMFYNSCVSPHSDCTKISGKLIVIKEKITSADIRIIKWLTGYTVSADFIESNFISNKWLVRTK